MISTPCRSHRVYQNAVLYAFNLIQRDEHVLGLISIPLLCHAIVLVCALHYAMRWLLLYLSGICLSAIDRARAREDKIDNDAYQYLSMDGQVKYKISEDPYLFISEKGKHNLVSYDFPNCFNFWLLLISYNSNIFLSIDIVILSFACSILVS
jgi:hypothetical protein